MKTIEEIEHWIRFQHDRIGQTRVNGDPYWAHTERVADLVLEHYNNDINVYVAGLAHDVLEDVTDLTEEEIALVIGGDSLSLVKEVTNQYTKEAYPDDNRSTRKASEALRLGNISKDAKMIKLADIVDNLSDVGESKPDMAELYRKEKGLVLKLMRLDDPTIVETKLYKMALELTI